MVETQFCKRNVSWKKNRNVHLDLKRIIMFPVGIQRVTQYLNNVKCFPRNAHIVSLNQRVISQISLYIWLSRESGKSKLRDTDPSFERNSFRIVYTFDDLEDGSIFFLINFNSCSTDAHLFKKKKKIYL